MSAPTIAGLAKLKRIARYLRSHGRWVQVFARQKGVVRFVCKSDSNFAGCKITRKSTSSTYLFHGNHLIRASSSTQQIIGLSTGEAEFMALAKAASVGYGAISMARDLGLSLDLVCKVDATAAQGIAQRRGVGKIRHLHTPLLWVQQRVEQGLRIRKIPGTENAADMGTKYLGGPEIAKYMAECGFTLMEGRSSLEKDVVAQ